MATKSKDAPLPTDLPTLARWLAVDPKEHVKRLEAALLGLSAEEFSRRRDAARMALQWAWDEQPETFFPLLKHWLGDKAHVRLRWVATAALPISHEGVADKVERTLKKSLQDKDREVRLVAIDYLAEDVKGQLETVRKAARTPDPAVKAVVARHLAGVDVETLKKILPLLEELALDTAPEVHWQVAATLYDLYEREPRDVLKTARKMAEHPDPGPRAAVASSFFTHVFSDHFDQLQPTIRAWLKDGNPELRWTLVRALRFLRTTGRSLQLLRALYEDKDPEVRRRVVQHLVDVFDPGADYARPVAELLRRAKEDQSKRVREVAEEGEERLGVRFDALQLSGASLEEPEEEGEGELEEGEEPEAESTFGDEEDDFDF